MMVQFLSRQIKLKINKFYSYLFSEIVQLILSCTEIKWYYVEGNSKGILIVLKGRIDDLVVLGREIPDLRFQTTEQNIIKRNKNFINYLTL